MNRYTLFSIVITACIALASCFSADKGIQAPVPISGDEPEEKPESKLQIAFISHTYYVNRHNDIQQTVIQEINAANPKYVFALGDVVLLNTDDLWAETFEFFSQLNAPVITRPAIMIFSTSCTLKASAPIRNTHNGAKNIQTEWDMLTKWWQTRKQTFC